MKRQLRIVLLEDCSIDAELVRLELARGQVDHVCQCVSTKKEFLVALSEFRPDLILADYSLRDITGTEAVCLAREHDPDIPIILITGALGDELAVKLIKSGATDYILKDRLFRLVPAIRRAVLEFEHRIQCRQGEAKFQALLESAPDAMIIVNQAQEIELVNSQTEKMFGFRREELLGQNVEKLVPNCSRDGLGWEDYLVSQSSRSTSSLSDGLYGLRKDGVKFALEVRLNPLQTETGPLVIVALRDVTNRKKAEDDLRKSEERFRQLAESIHEVFWMTDLSKNQTIYVSPGYEGIWGRTCESLYASPRNWVEAIHPEDRTRILQAALTKQIVGQYDEDYRIIRPDGSIRWIPQPILPCQSIDRALCSPRSSTRFTFCATPRASSTLG